MHLPAFMVIYRKHHPVSPSLKLTLVYVNVTFLFRFGIPSLSSLSICNLSKCNANCVVHFSALLKYIDLSVTYIPEKPCSESYTFVPICETHNEAPDPSRQTCRNKQTQTYTVYADDVFAGRESPRERVLFPRGWKTVGRLFSLADATK